MTRQTKREYRVIWKREGQPRRRKLYQTERGAKEFMALLTDDPGELPEDDGAWDSEHYKRMTAPFEEAPMLESRDVGEWEAVSA